MSTSAEPLVKTIQRRVVRFLAEQAELKPVTIIGPREGMLFSELTPDVESAISAALAESGGACLYVPPAKILKIDANTTGPFADSIEVRIRCIEDPKLNTKLPSYLELHELALTLLHEQGFPEITGLNQILAHDIPIEEQPDATRLIADAIFRTSGGLPARGRQTS